MNSRNVCIGRKGNDGCGFSNGNSGDTCPNCGGMVLSELALLKTELETIKAENTHLRQFVIADLEAEIKRLQKPKQSMSLNDVLEAASKNIKSAPKWLKKINERNNEIDQQRFGLQADEQNNEAKVNDDN